MARFPNPYAPGGQAPYGAELDANRYADIVARFFNAVYGWMAAGLALTAVVAWYVAAHPVLMRQLLGGPGIIVLFIAQIALVITISAAVRRISAPVATILFLLYAALMGVTLSFLLLIYAKAIIFGAFAATAGTFGAMSVYGMVTRRDLSAWGSLLFMALVGIIIASVVSMFWHSTLLIVAINYIGVLVFIGLTAYDTQRLKVLAIQTANSPEAAARFAINGALALYLDFINLFIFIVQILGDRRQ